MIGAEVESDFGTGAAPYIFCGRVARISGSGRIEVLFSDGEMVRYTEAGFKSACAVKRLGKQRRDEHAERLAKRRKNPDGTLRGQRLEVFWDDGRYYAGECVGYDASSGKHTMLYDGGSMEVLWLRRQGGQHAERGVAWRLCRTKRQRKTKKSSRPTIPRCQFLADAAPAISPAFRGRGASRFIGVSRDNTTWRAAIQCDGNKHCLGSHSTQEEAARAYDRAALAFRGGEARLNFPDAHVRTKRRPTCSAAVGPRPPVKGARGVLLGVLRLALPSRLPLRVAGLGSRVKAGDERDGGNGGDEEEDGGAPCRRFAARKAKRAIRGACSALLAPV